MKVSEQLKHWSSMANLTSSKESVLSADQLDEIAESFRELEQEAQKNLEGAFAWQQRAEAAEQANEEYAILADSWEAHARSAIAERNDALAKLAELDKQEPVAWISQSEMALIRPTDKRCVEATLWGVQRFDEAPLYARPVPAVNLADLAPDFDNSRASFEAFMNANYDTRLKRSGIGYAGQVVNQMWQTWIECRAAILRNIEEANIPTAKVGSVADTEAQAGEASGEEKSK